VSLGRLLAIGGAAGPGLQSTRAAADDPAVAAELNGAPADAELQPPAAACAGAATHVLPAGCTFELAGRRPSIVDVPAGERGPVS